MKIKPIKTEKGYVKAVTRIGEIWEAQPGSREAVELECLLPLIEDYEEINYRVYPADPIEAIKMRMQELGLSRRDLAGCAGSEDRITDILDRSRPLTPAVIRKLSERLKMSDRRLKAPYRLTYRITG